VERRKESLLRARVFTRTAIFVLGFVVLCEFLFQSFDTFPSEKKKKKKEIV